MSVPTSGSIATVAFLDGTQGTYIVLETFPCRGLLVVLLANQEDLDGEHEHVEVITGELVNLGSYWRVQPIADPQIAIEASLLAQNMCASWEQPNDA